LPGSPDTRFRCPEAIASGRRIAGTLAHTRCRDAVTSRHRTGPVARVANAIVFSRARGRRGRARDDDRVRARAIDRS
jgi:hypothetical protein